MVEQRCVRLCRDIVRPRHAELAHVTRQRNIKCDQSAIDQDHYGGAAMTLLHDAIQRGIPYQPQGPGAGRSTRKPRPDNALIIDQGDGNGGGYCLAFGQFFRIAERTIGQ